MDGFVLVTLQQPWHDADGKVAPLHMKYGYTEAKAIMVEDEYGRARSRAQKGKPIVYTLDWAAGRKSVIMPETAARALFGHWDIPDTAEQDTPAYQTLSFDRDRVAMNWGGYITVHLDTSNKKNYALPYIAPPNVPHVVVTDVDDNIEGEPIYHDPWARYKWQEQCTPLESLTPTMQLPPGYVNPNAPVSGNSELDMLKRELYETQRQLRKLIDIEQDRKKVSHG